MFCAFFSLPVFAGLDCMSFAVLCEGPLPSESMFCANLSRPVGARRVCDHEHCSALHNQGIPSTAFAPCCPLPCWPLWLDWRAARLLKAHTARVCVKELLQIGTIAARR